MGKLKNLFMAGVMATAMGHATKADAQTADKTKAKTTHVVNQSPEFWLNSTNGDRMLVRKSKTGVDIVDTAGNGFHVSLRGKVTFAGTELDANDPDTKLMNTIAFMSTGQAFYKEHAGTIYSVDNKKVTFDKDGNGVIVGAKGDSDLYEPIASEKDSKASQAFYENMKTQNPKLAEVAAKAIEGISFTELSPEARKFVSPDHYTSSELAQAYMPGKDIER